MQTDRALFLSHRLSDLLARLSPPASIKANADAQRAEIAQMLKSIQRAAPTSGYQNWWQDFEEALSRRMKTRAWPIISEIEAAAEIISPDGHGGASDDMAESAAVSRMADWFARFKAQMPGHGRSSRSAELIRNGTFANEAEARFYGFDLDPAQMERAKGQQECHAATRHHNRVMDQLRVIRERNAVNAEAVKAARKQHEERGEW